MKESVKPIMASEATLRDMFAAKAMEGIVGEYVWLDIPKIKTDEMLDALVKTSFAVADAMLKQREK